MTKVNSVLKYAGDFTALLDADPSALVNAGWVQNKISSLGSALKLKGSIDGSTGAVTPSTTGAAGDTYYVTGAPIAGASFLGSSVRNGDALVVLTAYSSAPTAANFLVLEKNDDLASTSIAGLIQIATQAIASSGSDNTQAITALTLAGVLSLGLYTKKLSVTNPVLIPSSGVCSWVIPNTFNSADIITQLLELATNSVGIADINITASTITVSINSTSNIAANSFKLVAVGI